MAVGRKPIRGRAGLWSVRQAADALALPLRATRTAVVLYGELFEQPFRTTDYLEDADLLPIKALAFTQRAGSDLLWPDLMSSGRDTVVLRSVISNARQVWDHPQGADQLMLLTSQGVYLATTVAERSALLDQHAHEPVLTLPVGRWAEAINALVQHSNRPATRSA